MAGETLLKNEGGISLVTDLREGDVAFNAEGVQFLLNQYVYIDDPNEYGGDKGRATVSTLTPPALGWTFGVEREKLTRIGHLDPSEVRRVGNGFTMDYLHGIKETFLEMRERHRPSS